MWGGNKSRQFTKVSYARRMLSNLKLRTKVTGSVGVVGAGTRNTKVGQGGER